MCACERSEKGMEFKMEDMTSKEIQEKINNQSFSKRLMQVDISSYRRQLELKQQEFERFNKEVWFPTVNKLEANEVPYELWDKKNSLDDSVRDLKQKIEDTQRQIDNINESIASLEEKLRQAQEKEKKEAIKKERSTEVAETIVEEAIEEMQEKVEEPAKEEGVDIFEEESKPDLEELLEILKGNTATNTSREPEEIPTEVAETIVEEAIEEMQEKVEEPAKEEIAEEGVDIFEEEPTPDLEDLLETLKGNTATNTSREQKEILEKDEEPTEENSIVIAKDIQRESLEGIFKQSSERTRKDLKAIPVKKKWTEIIMKKIKELAQKGKAVIDSFRNR